jgi:hypothetical protein
MKKLFSILLISLLYCGTIIAQSATEFPAMDKSPMDMSYYPANYPSLKIQNKITESLVARVIYSRPQKSGRVIFGGLVEYGKVWRLGANEATEIEFYKHVRIGGKKISKGRYTLYAIPYEDKWTIILNKETDIWGAFKYDPKKDVVRVDAQVQKNNDQLEALAIIFEKTTEGADLVIGWDTVKVSLPVTF